MTIHTLGLCNTYSVCMCVCVCVCVCVCPNSCIMYFLGEIIAVATLTALEKRE